MKLPRDISGSDLIRALCRDWGYRQVHQVGSHVILQTDEPMPQRLAIPDHRSLRIGTLNAILHAVATHKRVLRETILKSL